MIYFDVTKTSAARHQSGLMRLSGRLREELGAAVRPVSWDGRAQGWRDAVSRRPVRFASSDRLLTVELFSEPERPGFWRFLRDRPCRLAAVFCDAIPLQHPQFMWPQSVARHPEYMKMLAAFDRVWAISVASRDALTGFWRWQQAGARAAVEVLALGADFERKPRATVPAAPPVSRALLCVGILEPRKNQMFLLDVCEALWREGLGFDLHLVGRVNPHFGRPLARRLRALRQREPRVHHHAAAPDALLERLYAAARATAVPTLAEGYGLPLLESLWQGRPCVGSDLPVLREIAAGGGCVLAAPNDLAAWTTALRTVLTDDGEWRRLAAEAAARPLPTWADTARTLLAALPGE
jgi:glycosyltransferase involved in cell wall biosynthesis